MIRYTNLFPNAIPPVLTIIVCVLVAVLISQGNRRNRENKLFAALCLLQFAMAVNLLCSLILTSQELALQVSRITHIFFVFGVPLAIQFVHQVLGIRHRRWLEWLAYLFSICLLPFTQTDEYILSGPTYSFGFVMQSGPMLKLYAAVGLVAIIYSMVLLGHGWVRARLPLMQRKLQILFWGMPFGWLLIALNIIPAMGVELYPPSTFSFIPWGWMAYGMIRKNIWESANLFFKRGYLGQLLTLMMYFFLLAGVAFVLFEKDQVNFVGWNGLADRIYPYGIPPILSVITCFSLARFCFIKAGRQLETLLFGIMCSLYGLLSLEKLMQMVIREEAIALVVARVDHFFLVNILGISIHLVYILLKNPNRLFVRTMYLIGLILVPLTQTEYYYLAEMHHHSFGWFGHQNWAFEVFVGFGLVCILWGGFLFARQYLQETNPQLKKRWGYLFIGLVLTGLLNAGNAPAANGNDFYPLGNFSFFPLLIMAYGIFRHDLIHVNIYARRRVAGSVVRLVTLLIMLALIPLSLWVLDKNRVGLSYSDLVPYGVPPLISIICCFGMALMSHFLGRNQRESLLFSLICLIYGLLNFDLLVGVLVVDPAVVRLITPLNHLFLVLQPALNLHLIYLLTQQEKRFWLVRMAYVASLAMLPVTQADWYLQNVEIHHWGMAMVAGPGFHLLTLMTSGSLLMAIYWMVQAWRNSREPVARIRLKYFFIGLIIVAVFNIGNLPMVYGGDFYPVGTFTFIPIILFGYGLFRDKINEALQVIRSLLFWVGLAFWFWLISLLLNQQLEIFEDPFKLLLIVSVVVFFYFPVLRGWNTFMNLFIYNHADNLKQQFQLLVDRLSKIQRLQALHQCIARMMFKELMVSRCSLLFYNTNKAQFNGWESWHEHTRSFFNFENAEIPKEDRNITISTDHPLMPLFRQRRALIYQNMVEEWIIDQNVDMPLDDYVRQSDFILPVFFEDKLKCLLIIYDKVNGGEYSREEQKFLRQLGMVLGPYVENTEMFSNQEERIYARTEQLQNAYNELAHMNFVLQKISATLNFDEVMNSVIDVIKLVFRFDQLSIHLLDEPTQELYFAHTWGNVIEKERIAQFSKIRCPLTQRQSIFVIPVLKNRRVYLPSIDSDFVDRMSPYDRDIYQLMPAKACLCFPLAVQNKVLGTISFGSYRENFNFSEEQLESIERYVTQIAIAINNASMYVDILKLKEKAERHSADLQNSNRIISRQNRIFRVLLETSSEIQKTQSIEDLLNSTLTELKKLFPHLDFGVILEGERAMIIEYAVFLGINEEEQDYLIKNQNRLQDEDFLQALNSRFRDTSSDFLLDDEDLETTFSDWLVMPMQGKEHRLRGKLIIKGQQLGVNNQDIIRVFLEQLTSVVENKLLTRELEKLANTDSLTNCYNRTFFNRELERYIQTSNRFPNVHFSLLMLDVNGLKRVNDEFGHEKGDEMIIKVAQLLMKVCRKSDIVTRLGGDEFVVLCPSTGYAQAEKLLNRIRKDEEVLIMQCTHADGTQEEVPIHMSVGISSTEDTPPNEVLKLADHRMYADKEAYYSKIKRYR